jgi:hypothetical protein
MTFSEEQVERIVVEVIRRLRLLGALPDSGDHGDCQNELRVGERVVTMRTLEGRLGGVKRFIVAARTVVTPAVIDELKTRRIELVREQ